MKARLLVGLLTVALGGLTSCSNILEENGVINNVAESGMGELRINLSTDVSLNVSTKATEPITTSITENDFSIFGTLQDQTQESSLGKYKQTMTVGTGTYTKFRAVYDGMGSNLFAYDAPYFEGEATNGETGFPVATGNTTKATINTELKNSVITVNLGNLKDLSTITKLELRDKETSPTKTFDLMELVDLPDPTQKPIFVKAGLTDACIHIEGHMNDNPSKTYIRTNQINDGKETGTKAKQKYAVAYKLSTDNGLLQLTIGIDKNVEIIDIDVPPIDPYKENNN